MRSLSWTGLPALAGIVLLIAAQFYAGLHGDRSRADAEQWRMHAAEVMLEAERVLSAFQDAETGERDFLLTRDPEDLQHLTKPGFER
jgi:CHASE3 domain sensor protein